MIAPRDVLFHELIGRDVLVAAAGNPSHEGISGRILDETKHMLMIDTPRGIKRIPKRLSIFRLSISNDRVVEIDGSAIALAPEKRISLHSRKRIP